MSQTQKGNPWYLGLKVHIGVDLASDLVHTVVGTTAKGEVFERPRRGLETDITQLPDLLHGHAQVVLGDATQRKARPPQWCGRR